MITITQKTINLKAEGLYGEIMVQGGTEVNGKQIGVVSGSIFNKNQSVGNFTSGDFLSITLDNKENVGLMISVTEAITNFVDDLAMEINAERF